MMTRVQLLATLYPVMHEAPERRTTGAGLANVSSALTWIARRIRWVAAARSGSSAVVQTLFGRILVLGVSLFNGILSARYLGADGRGAQAAMALWPQFICFILTLGIPFGLLYHARKHEGDRNALFSTALILSAGLGVVAALVGYIFIPLWLHQYDARMIRFAQWLMFFSPQIMVSLVMNAIFDVQFDFAPSNLLRFGPPVITLFALLGLIVVHNFTPFSSSLAYAIPPALLSTLLLRRLRMTFAFTLNDFKRSSRRLFGYGIRVYGSDVLGTFGLQVDQILVVGFLSPSDLGIYTVALSASRVLNVFQTSVKIVLLPKVAGLDPHEIARLVGRVARLSTAMTLIGAFALIFALPLLLPHLYGHDFTAAILVAQILTIESVMASTTSVLTQTFMATNRPGIATLLQAVGLAFAVPLMLILIPRLGLLGAALSLSCSTGLRLITALICYPALLKLPIPSLLIARADVYYLIQALRERRRA